MQPSSSKASVNLPGGAGCYLSLQCCCWHKPTACPKMILVERVNKFHAHQPGGDLVLACL